MHTNESCLVSNALYAHYAPSGEIVADVFFRKMNGGSQSCLVGGSDGNFYILKMKDNPQGPNVIFNEAFGSVLAEFLGLPVPTWRPVRVGSEFIEKNPDLCFVLGGGIRIPRPGLHFASSFIAGSPDDEVYEIVPHSWMDRIAYPSLFARMLLLDLWTENVDRRQVLFIERSQNRALDVVFIDHGHMFGGPHGDRNLGSNEACHYYHRKIYERAFQSSTIEDWLDLLEGLDATGLKAMVKRVPQEWRSEALENATVARLLKNQKSLRQKIGELTRNVVC